ncbi:vacuolar import/degradation protein Vid24 [Artemisia annua]|uniref:Vacuolar import/degradation protein Vid24 n=1 Tax=Artemisia annua TaxID=35608 RepID=A0A2U1PPY1_ARTAN|nr:vacuolar import/degradation protein Vid24 [Artemisia annua]
MTAQFAPWHDYLCQHLKIDANVLPTVFYLDEYKSIDLVVVTFWEGEIVDTKNYTFFTNKWKATSEVDIEHWSKFPSFSPLLTQVEVDGGKSLDLSNYQYIFMRWKEQYFVNVGADCGLTIAGFYYVCFSCVDGSINGYYYDPNSR